MLSPFEVSTSREVGCLATNSPAGSRLNASLKDTPAIIDVFTKEFLEDIGATNRSDLDDSLRFDAMLRHQARGSVFGRNVRASFQLNVRNLLDEHHLEVRRHKTDGLTLDRFVFTDPRELTLSTTLRF